MCCQTAPIQPGIKVQHAKINILPWNDFVESVLAKPFLMKLLAI
jgi:hypothetical protein